MELVKKEGHTPRPSKMGDAQALAALRAQIKLSVKPWPDYMTAISSVTIALSILGNGWIVVRGLISPHVRRSAFHIILISQGLTNLLLSAVVFSGIVNSKMLGMGETMSRQNLCRAGMTMHMWLLSVGLCTHGLMAANRALSCITRLKTVLCTTKATCSILAVIWLVCLFPYLAVVVKNSTSFNGAFGCQILDEYVDNVLAGKELRQVKPAITTTRDAVTSFVATAILVTAGANVIIVNALGKQGEGSQGGVAPTSLAVSLLFMAFMSFWMPHVVSLYFDQALSVENDVYVYLPMLGTAVAPALMLLTIPEFRIQFSRGNGGEITPSGVQVAPAR